MATSGTVGATSFTVATLIEKAYRRCNILPGLVTPELIDIAKENLAMLFSNFSNRGVNLWCVEQPLIGIQENKAAYSLPVGTIDVLNAYYRNITSLSSTLDSSTATQYVYALDDGAVTVTLIGFKLSTAATGVTIAASTDSITYTTLATETAAYNTNTWYWVPVDASVEATYWRLTFPAAATLVDFVASSTFNDLTIARINVDDYHALPNKTFTGNPPTNYWMDRQISPTMTLWPVPNTELGCLALVTHREIQDVGAITNTLDIPNRWLDAVLWQLALMCATEIPTVPADRIALCQQMAQQSLFNADSEERDTAPIYLRPNISGYNR